MKIYATTGTSGAFTKKHTHNCSSMSCRIELPEGELCRISPNFGYLTTLLGVLTPDALVGTVSLQVSVSGVCLKFAGAREWSGQSLCSAMIPRWMFADAAFRELIARRAREFVDLLDGLRPNGASEDPEGLGWSEDWALG